MIWHDTPDTGDGALVDEHECAVCAVPVGWCLAEVQDTYDSGYERPEWCPYAETETGAKLCEDCALDREEGS